jgi:hypothetical protein
MKLIALLAALALTETSITNSLPAHMQRIEQVAINEGKASIEVFTDGDKEDLTCTFMHAGTIVGEQVHTKHCYVIAQQASLPYYLSVRVANNEGHPIHYTLRASTILPIK